MLAVVYAIHRFKYNLLGANFLLEVDHKPHIYLIKFKGDNARLMRRAFGRQSYNFQIFTSLDVTTSETIFFADLSPSRVPIVSFALCLWFYLFVFQFNFTPLSGIESSGRVIVSYARLLIFFYYFKCSNSYYYELLSRNPVQLVPIVAQ